MILRSRPARCPVRGGVVVAILVAACFGRSVAAFDGDGKPTTPAAAAISHHSADSASSSDLRQLVQKLDSDSFAAREFAAQRLIDVGRPAIGPLAESARGHSYEQTAAAIDLLHRFLNSTDGETRTAAKAALEHIAGSESDAAARLAADALQPPAEIAQANGQFVGPGMVNVMQMQQVMAIRNRQLLRAARRAAGGAVPLIKLVPAQAVNPLPNAPQPAPAPIVGPQKPADAK